MRIITYNVNGLRACLRKGLLGWLANNSPDVLCLQESRVSSEQVDWSGFRDLGYHSILLNSSIRKGYSGVAILSKTKPDYVEVGMGVPEFDVEARVVRADFGDRTIVCVYHPSGASGDERIIYKMRFHKAWQSYIRGLRSTREHVIICGDFNIAHEPIDIHDPIRNSRVSGFLPEERLWFADFLQDGYVDAWRHLNPNKIAYSWWSLRGNAKVNNKGWRIDYCLLSLSLLPFLASAVFHTNLPFSDHCPLEVMLL